jgi:thiol-disulfide isomerase/thioredoxin
VVAAVLALWAWYDFVNGVRLSSPERSALATPLQLFDLEGNEVSLESLRGRVVLLSAWASWCPPCRAEIPRLNRLVASAGEDLVVLGANVEGFDADRLARVRDELGIEYRVVVPRDGFTGNFDWDGLLPYTWLIDRQGRIRARHGGLPVERSLRRACEELLREGESQSGGTELAAPSSSGAQAARGLAGRAVRQLDHGFRREVQQRAPTPDGKL